ncbi:MAG: hypothetical protein ABFD89_04785 [Bryobacteraceae bacterium]
MGRTAGGLYLPETAVHGQRWIGWVVGVGPDAEGIEFGDLLELNRWSEGQWHVWPARDLAGAAGSDVLLTDGIRSVVAPGSQMWAFVRPGDIGYRIATLERMTTGKGRSAGIYPIADRVLVRHVERKLSPCEIEYMREYNPLADVLDVGSLVDDVMPGDRVILSSGNVGLHVQTADGWVSLVRISDVLTVVGGDVERAEVSGCG